MLSYQDRELFTEMITLLADRTPNGFNLSFCAFTIHFFYNVLKVREFQKQFILFSILPKTKQNICQILAWLLGQKLLVHFLEELRTRKIASEINWPYLVWMLNVLETKQKCLKIRIAEVSCFCLPRMWPEFQPECNLNCASANSSSERSSNIVCSTVYLPCWSFSQRLTLTATAEDTIVKVNSYAPPYSQIFGHCWGTRISR